MPRRTAALFLALALTSSPALAQNPSQADQDACTPDVFKLCQDFVPDEGQIVACLQSKHAQLSPACEPVIFPHAGTAPATPTTPGATPKRHKRHKHKAA